MRELYYDIQRQTRPLIWNLNGPSCQIYGYLLCSFMKMIILSCQSWINDFLRKILCLFLAVFGALTKIVSLVSTEGCSSPRALEKAAHVCPSQNALSNPTGPDVAVEGYYLRMCQPMHLIRSFFLPTFVSLDDIAVPSWKTLTYDLHHLWVQHRNI